MATRFRTVDLSVFLANSKVCFLRIRRKSATAVKNWCGGKAANDDSSSRLRQACSLQPLPRLNQPGVLEVESLLNCSTSLAPTSIDLGGICTDLGRRISGRYRFE
jgi:hypothetical protein